METIVCGVYLLFIFHSWVIQDIWELFFSSRTLKTEIIVLNDSWIGYQKKKTRKKKHTGKRILITLAPDNELRSYDWSMQATEHYLHIKSQKMVLRVYIDVYKFLNYKYLVFILKSQP